MEQAKLRDSAQPNASVDDNKVKATAMRENPLKISNPLPIANRSSGMPSNNSVSASPMPAPVTEPKRNLGRGLQALFQESDVLYRGAAASPAVVSSVGGNVTNGSSAIGSETQDKIVSVNLKSLQGGSLQPRRKFDEMALQELSQSIAKHGILQPLVIRPLPKGVTGKTPFVQYEIIAGERRWRAADLAGLKDVPAILHHINDEVSLQIALIENLQREDLTALEEAESYQKLISQCGLTQIEVAEAVGKSRSHITNLLRLLSLPSAIQHMLQDGKLTAGHARALLSLKDPMPLAERIIAERLSVREVETLVKQELRSLNPSEPLKDMFEAKDMSDSSLKSIQDTAAALQRKVTTTTTNTTAGTSGNRSSAVSSSIDPDIGSLQAILSQKLKMTVAIKSTGTSGSLVIDFADLQQLDRLIEILSQG